MNLYKGKKILLLGGSIPYRRAAKAAKELGLYVIVVDQNASDEVLKYSDEYIKTSLTNIKFITEWCQQNPVDGILNMSVDFAQKTYLELCNTLHLPCCYNEDQVNILSNKILFKKLLVDCGLEQIKSYNENDIINNNVHYPIIIKPSEGSGSRGSCTCYSYNEGIEGIKKAKQESRNGDIIIEELIQDAQELQITFFLCNGQLYVIRTADSYEGDSKDGLERLVACSISPSRYTSEYFKSTHDLILKMVEKLGLKNGPFFIQGFYHKGNFKFFDPGCRFPGVDFENLFIKEYDIDFARMMVIFAISGNMPDIHIPNNIHSLNGKKAAVLFPVIKKGVISRIEGLDSIEKLPNVFSITKRHTIGDVIDYTYDVNQRLGEIDIVADSDENLKKVINDIYTQLHVSNEKNEEMIYSLFDVKRITF